MISSMRTMKKSAREVMMVASVSGWMEM
jgi:hypothetical protein